MTNYDSCVKTREIDDMKFATTKLSKKIEKVETRLNEVEKDNVEHKQLIEKLEEVIKQLATTSENLKEMINGVKLSFTDYQLKQSDEELHKLYRNVRWVLTSIGGVLITMIVTYFMKDIFK